MNRFSSDAESLKECVSTQANESFNAMVAAKCSKAKHYFGSHSIFHRVAAAVCQKSIGVLYSERMYGKLEFSPPCPKVKKFLERKQKMREKKSDRGKTKDFKCRRNKLKNSRRRLHYNKERSEGISTDNTDCSVP